MPRPSKGLVSDPLSAGKRLSPSMHLYEPSSKSGTTFHDVLSEQDLSEHSIDPERATTDPPPIPLPSLNPKQPSPPAPCPRLIILLTWMAANPTHIIKYIQAYQILYPGATILLIRTSAQDILFRRTRAQCRNLQPAISVITSSCPKTAAGTAHESIMDPTCPDLLLHIFSNGGSICARNLLHTYLSSTSHLLPLHATILDSCPGRPSFSRTVLALSSALPNAPLLRTPLLLLVYLFVGVYWLISTHLGISNPILRLREALNDKTLVDETRRCYVYSEEDPMVSWRAVEDHATDAQAKGFRVRTEKFKGSGHCAHVREGRGERYWQLVDETWRGDVA